MAKPNTIYRSRKENEPNIKLIGVVNANYLYKYEGDDILVFTNTLAELRKDYII